MQKIRRILFITIILSNFKNVAFSQVNWEDSTKSQLLNAIKKLDAIFNSIDSIKDNGFGRSVDIDENFWGCIKRYRKIMDEYGFEEAPDGQSRNRFKPSRKVTFSVSFRGKELLSWFLSIPAPDQKPENIDLRILKGIYTKEFIDKYHADIGRINRISVFLVPYNKLTNSIIGTSAFDLGGLKP